MIAAPDVAKAANEGTASQAYATMLEQLYARASSSFAASTPASSEAPGQLSSAERTSVTTVADPEVIAEFADAPELRAVEELRAWLRLTYREVALVAGLSSPSLLHHWRERHHAGRPVRARASSIERLWRVHSLIRAVAEALEGADQSYAVQLWVRNEENGVTPLELLLQGDLEQVERLARGLLFSGGARGSSPSRTATLEQDQELEPVAHLPLPTYRDSDFG